MQNPVVTRAVARNDDDDDDEEEASAEKPSHHSTHCGQESVPGSPQARHCIRHKPSGEVPGKTFKIRPHCVETSFAISVWYDGLRAEAVSTKQSVLNADSVHR